MNKPFSQPPNKLNARQNLMKQIRISLGEPKIRLEITPDQLELAVDIALERYRYRSSNSVMEKFTFVELQVEQTVYQLPESISEVRQILRRGTSGTISGGGSQLDPFSLAYTNQYLLQAGREGGLTTYELFAGFQKTVGRLFGENITFQFNKDTKELHIDRDVRAPESVLLWIYEHKADEFIIKDQQSRTWIRDYSIAKCKEFLGEIRGKWSNFAVPGGSSLNGEALKQEAQATMERLEAELMTNTDGDIGYFGVIG